MAVLRACRVSVPARPDVVLRHRFEVLPATSLFPYWRRLLFARYLATSGRLSDFGPVEGWLLIGRCETDASTGAPEQGPAGAVAGR